MHAPDPSRPYTIHTDASDFALGAELLQDFGNGQQPIAYHSRKLSAAEVNYPTHDKEMLAIIDSLRTWRHLVLGSKGLVLTDHNTLTFFQTQRSLSRRQARWMEYLAEYDCAIKYFPGKSNIVADALSRRPDLALNAIGSVSIDASFRQELQSAYLHDSEACKLLTAIHAGSDPYLKLQDGLILYTKQGAQRIYVPSAGNLRNRLLYEHHDSQTAGHLGVDKTLTALAAQFWWPQFTDSVRSYVRSCDSCQRNKSSDQAQIGLLQPIPLASRRWSQVTMDLITQLPRTPRGFDAVITFVDHLSKMVHFAPCHTADGAPQVARLFFDHVFRLHGMPRTIISDRDGRFLSKFWQALFKLVGTKLAMSTSFHPQTDGSSERANRTLEDMLRAYTSSRQDDWDLMLSAAEFAYNNSKQSSTGFTPFFLNYGQNPETPAQLLSPSPTEHAPPADPSATDIPQVPASQAFIDNLEATLQLAVENLRAAQQRQAEAANRHRREYTFGVGDEVRLSTVNLRKSACGLARKLLPKFVGPCTVRKVVSPVAVELELPPELSRIHPVFHTSLLLPYSHRTMPPSDSSSSSQEHQGPLPLWQEDEGDVYEVDRILDKRTRVVRDGNRTKRITEYLIRWKGYSEESDSWEPLSNLRGAAVAEARNFQRSRPTESTESN